MRTSKDLYKLPNGETVAVSGAEQAPHGAQLFSGYNYNEQRWYFEGKPDTRTLKELQTSIDNSTSRLKANAEKIQTISKKIAKL